MTNDHRPMTKKNFFTFVKVPDLTRENRVIGFQVEVIDVVNASKGQPVAARISSSDLAIRGSGVVHSLQPHILERANRS
jgi:hypothetical protein